MKLADISGTENKAYLKAEIEEIQTNSKIKNIMEQYRGINDVTKGYQLRTNKVKEEKSDLVADSHSILARWRKYFSQALNIHGVNYVRQKEMHTAEPLVLEPSAFEVELTKSHKSPGIDRTPAELIKVRGRKILYEIHNLLFLFE